MAIAPSMTVLVLCVIGGIQPSLAQSQSIVDGPYGQDLLECKAEWDKISEDGDMVSECMQAFIWAVGLKLREPEGIPALGIKEPVTFPELQMITPELRSELQMITPKPITDIMKGRFLSIHVYNVSTYLQPELTKITYDPATQIATSVTNAKEVHAFADYEFSLNTGACTILCILPGPASTARNGGWMDSTGKGEVVAYDAVNTLKMYMKRLNHGGLTISKVESSTVVGDWKIKAAVSADSSLKDNFLDDKKTVKFFADMVIIPIFNEQAAQTVQSIFNKGWNKLEQL